MKAIYIALLLMLSTFVYAESGAPVMIILSHDDAQSTIEDDDSECD